jgi:hypothetical protein
MLARKSSPRRRATPTCSRTIDTKWDCHGDEAPPYDANADFAKSLDDCYRAVRERVAAGGKGWNPP